MIDILSEVEGEPSSYPSQPSDLSTGAQALDTESIWKRLEDWISYRWGERTVTWIVQGPGWWKPRLRPVTVDSSEIWTDGAWESTTLETAPVGYELEDAIYRVTATVGTTDSVPAEMNEAYRRLAEYLADQSYIGRVATSATQSAGKAQVSADRPAAWQAKALHYSGAADLLRRYR